MLKTLLVVLIIFKILSSSLFALEISLKGAKENHQDYSILHVKSKEKFLCQEIKSDFEITVEIVCAFTKSPAMEFKETQNSFFSIKTEIKKKTFFLIIKPFAKMKLYPMIFDLTKEDTVFSPNVELTNHWMVIGYKNEIPYIKQTSESDVTINFPFTLSKDKLPFVGSLDIEGNPVHLKRVGDVTEYLNIKKLFNSKKYELCLESLDDIMREYPNSLFTSEFQFYKIKVFTELHESDEVIELAKFFLREYASNDNVPEVLSLIANAYYLSGEKSNADYFFDRLFNEHPSSPYAYWGYIYKGEMLESSGASDKARVLFKKVIDETDNLDIAVEAAYRLAQNYIIASNYKDAAIYINKIVLTKPEYFLEKMSMSFEMMYDFRNNQDYISAAAIAKALYDRMNSNYDEYEELSRNVGIWLSKSENKKEAIIALNVYLDNFSDGKYEREVEIAKDALFFDVSDANFTTKLQNYDKLMNEYSGDKIGDKAIHEKAKLLIENKQFRDALEMENQLLALDSLEYKDVPKLITDSAVGTMQQALEKKECSSVLVISSQYKIELSNEWDDGIYECAMKGADFELARKMADKNLKSKDLDQRKKWLYRYIKVDFATGNYSSVIEASKELKILIKDDEKSPYIDVNRYLFDTYQRLEKSEKMIEAIDDIIKAYNENYIDIDRYAAVMSVGSSKKDTNLVIEYGQKIRNIQNLSDSYPQSPFVEFTLYQAYVDREANNEALDVIKSLDKIKLTSSQRARQKYLLGSVLDKLWRGDDAQKAYQEAIEADKDSAWAKLAQSAKGI